MNKKEELERALKEEQKKLDKVSKRFSESLQEFAKREQTLGNSPTVNGKRTHHSPIKAWDSDWEMREIQARMEKIKQEILNS